jgi:hypothetical protein
MQIRSVGIDLGKTTFHLVALDDNGKVLLKRKFTQKQLITFTANMQTSLIGMEACGGAHFLGRALRAQGHDVKLIPAQFVKPFVKSNKNAGRSRLSSRHQDSFSTPLTMRRFRQTSRRGSTTKYGHRHRPQPPLSVAICRQTEIWLRMTTGAIPFGPRAHRASQELFFGVKMTATSF